MEGEDLIILENLKNINNGLYVDVGCYHPISGNNTYLLYKKGWNGINFDISEFSIELFNFYRKKDKNIFCGISNKKGSKKVFYRKKIPVKKFHKIPENSRKFRKIPKNGRAPRAKRAAHAHFLEFSGIFWNFCYGNVFL